MLLLLAVPAAAQQDAVRSLNGRTVRWHMPEKKDGTLLVVFHIEGSSASSVQRHLRLDEQEGWTVAYPEGADKHWGPSDLELVRALVESSKAEYPRIYLMGLSEGGQLALYSAVALAADVAGAIAVMTSYPVWEGPGGVGASPGTSGGGQELSLASPVSLLLVHGDRDPVVPFPGGPVRHFGGQPRGEVLGFAQTLTRWAAALKATPGPETPLPDRDGSDGCRAFRQVFQGPSAEAVGLRIQGGGHTWPDGPQYLPATLVGAVCRDFNLAREVWEFCKTHPKNR